MRPSDSTILFHNSSPKAIPLFSMNFKCHQLVIGEILSHIKIGFYPNLHNLVGKHYGHAYGNHQPNAGGGDTSFSGIAVAMFSTFVAKSFTS